MGAVEVGGEGRGLAGRERGGRRALGGRAGMVWYLGYSISDM